MSTSHLMRAQRTGHWVWVQVKHSPFVAAGSRPRFVVAVQSRAVAAQVNLPPAVVAQVNLQQPGPEVTGMSMDNYFHSSLLESEQCKHGGVKQLEDCDHGGNMLQHVHYEMPK
ncbi:hypothetical protein [Dictyobacter arantiisoli]|uniref:Uncharacterized protein n=1 Tax=Dictyobacter arantiisoli TaxID=2014874 RepID=A0A5A5TCP9_9CHLR|nr:hypothetical protein [Dictyobacter arantiisoli]GCF08803.1 hypothetical protein KDI_23670 [Dictyobacter arantiisoli]